MSVEELLNQSPYSVPQVQKEQILLEELSRLSAHHRAHCPEYDRITRVMFPSSVQPNSLADLSYLPVSLFKDRLLSSIPPDEVFKTVLSSGTTGQRPSQIFLDRETAMLQTRALSRIMTHFLGPQRLPMLLIESPELITDRRQFNARAAGLLGMMNFGHHHRYALDAKLQPRLQEIRDFLSAFGQKPFLIFGFTYLVWSAFYQHIADLSLDLSNGILIHSGGWKTLQDQAVTAEEFRRSFAKSTGLTRIHNFYGMVEQVGSVFMEAHDGHFYPPCFADVIIRDPITFEELPTGQPGVVEVLSVLPRSYPGHCLLTEDLGVVHAVDPATGGCMGKAFSILGRIARAELRGCSDVIAASREG